MAISWSFSLLLPKVQAKTNYYGPSHFMTKTKVCVIHKWHGVKFLKSTNLKCGINLAAFAAELALFEAMIGPKFNAVGVSSVWSFKVSFPNEMGQNSSKLMVYCLPPKVTPPIDYTKGQLISEWIYSVIVSPNIRTKNCQEFCPV